jgi:predicted glycosyltransferase
VRRSAEPRLLVYSQDGLGLGHLRRSTLMAAEFLRARPGASALTISDSPLGRFFHTTSGHDYLKLPSIRKAGPGDWHPVALSSPFDDVLTMRRETIRSAVLGFQPDVLLVDHMPHGAMGELVPTLHALESRRVRLLLGLRDILDAPDVIRRRWHLEGAFEAVEHYYDEVLVYGSQDVFDVSYNYDWPAAATERLRYCGYVCSPAMSRPSQRIRTRYLAGAKVPLIVAMAGGGADAFPLFNALLRAVPAISADTPCVVVVITGPFLPPRERTQLARMARGRPVRLLNTVADCLTYMAAADLVVSMAGYNTTAEILSIGTPAVLVPRAGPSAEQETRARLFAERGWVRWLSPDHLSDSSLATMTLEMLHAGRSAARPAHELPNLGGRATAARRLLASLDDDVAPDVDDDAVPVTEPARRAAGSGPWLLSGG